MKKSMILGAALGLATSSYAFADDSKPLEHSEHFKVEAGAVEDVPEAEDAVQGLTGAAPAAAETTPAPITPAPKAAAPTVPKLPEKPVLDKIVNESMYAVCREDFENVEKKYDTANFFYNSVQKSAKNLDELQRQQNEYVKNTANPSIKKMLKFSERKEKLEQGRKTVIDIYTGSLNVFQAAYDALLKNGCGARKNQAQLAAVNADLEKKADKTYVDETFEKEKDHLLAVGVLGKRINALQKRADAHYVSVRAGYATVWGDSNTQGIYLAAELPLAEEVGLGVASRFGGRSFRPDSYRTVKGTSADGQVELVNTTTEKRNNFSWAVGPSVTVYPVEEVGIHIDTLAVWQERNVHRQVVSELRQDGKTMPGSRSDPQKQEVGRENFLLAPAVGLVLAPQDSRLEFFVNARAEIGGGQKHKQYATPAFDAGIGYRFGM